MKPILKNKYRIPLYIKTSIFDISLNCIDHYETIDDDFIYKRTLDRYGSTGIKICKKIKNVVTTKK